jgi:hypothetical protein
MVQVQLLLHVLGRVVGLFVFLYGWMDGWMDGPRAKVIHPIYWPEGLIEQGSKI